MASWSCRRVAVSTRNDSGIRDRWWCWWFEVAGRECATKGGREGGREGKSKESEGKRRDEREVQSKDPLLYSSTFSTFTPASCSPCLAP